MKYVFVNLRNFAKNNKLFFVLFVACQIISFIVLLFSFGAYQNSEILKNQKIKNTEFIMCFGNLVEEIRDKDSGEVHCVGDGAVDQNSVKRFLELLDKNTLESIKIIFYEAYDEDLYLDTYNDAENKGFEILFRMKYSKENDCFEQAGMPSVSSGATLSNKEYVEGSSNITLPMNCLESSLGKQVTIKGKTYTATGIDFIDEGITMSYYNTPDELDGIEYIDFIFNDLATKSAYDDIVKCSREVFGDYAYIPKVETVSDDPPFYNSLMILSILLAILSAVTIMLLYKYILQKRSRVTAILRLCGCSRRKAGRICTAEILLLSTVCAAAAYAIYFGIIVNAVLPYLIYIKYVYSAKNCAVIFLINIAAVFVFTKILIMGELRKSPNALLKKG